VSVLGEQAATTSSLILQYFEKFGTKHVAFSDLRPYVSALAREQQQEVVASLTVRWQAEPASPAEIYRDINLRALQRFSGGHAGLSPSQAEAEVSSLVARWRAVEPLVAGLLATDLRPSDSYLVLAAHLLWDLWQAHGATRHFLQAATVLHLGVAASPSNWQLKLLLIRLYGAAGCGSVSAVLQGDLDIKHLMLDSLGWLLPRQLWGSGHLEAAMAQLGATLRLYHHVNKDTADHIITAYRSGTFYQIRDIYRLRARITHSHHYATVDTERLLLQLLTDGREPGQATALLSGPELQLGVEESEWARLEDNRDLGTMVSWDPPELEVRAGEVEVSFRLEVIWARGRHLLLR
jgi:N-terminal acetyltransferase B complex non-catalytic subunit